MKGMVLYRIELTVGTVRHNDPALVCVESGGVIAFTMAHSDDSARGVGRVLSEVARGVVAAHTPPNPYLSLWNQQNGSRTRAQNAVTACRLSTCPLCSVACKRLRFGLMAHFVILLLDYSFVHS